MTAAAKARTTTLTNGAKNKSKRYDRQIRVWGSEGQRRLEASRALMLGSGPTSCEVAKNLILGGVRCVTIVDAKVLDRRDCGNNFMVCEKEDVVKVLSGNSSNDDDQEEKGKKKNAPHPKKRGAACCEKLRLLNEMVEVKYVDEDPYALVNKMSTNSVQRQHFLKEFDVVVATQLNEQTAIALDECCRELGKKLIVARSWGCLGSVKISGVDGTACVEVKPENRALDLRLGDENARLFPELLEYAENFEDLEVMDEQQFTHVPYVCLLLIAKKRFLVDAAKRGENIETLRDNYDAQKKFKVFLQSLRRTKTELNFEEAYVNARLTWQKPEIPKNVRDCFEKLPTMTTWTTLDDDKTLFWTFVAALEKFLKQNKNYLPLDAGALPDMTATTDAFVGLQKIFREKALKDQRKVLEYAKEIISSRKKIGNDTDESDTDCMDIEEKSLEVYCEKFCKNARDTRFLQFPSLKDESAAWKSEQSTAMECDDADNESSLLLERKQAIAKLLEADSASRVCAYSYALLRASDAFEAKLCRKPGAYSPEECIENNTLGDNENNKKVLSYKMTSDCAELRALVMKDLESAIFQSSSDASEAGKFLESLAWEVVRSQGGENHAVASVVGGIASQEVIKLITGLFVPLEGRLCVHLGDGSSAILP